jgi:hypothetical protein
MKLSTKWAEIHSIGTLVTISLSTNSVIQDGVTSPDPDYNIAVYQYSYVSGSSLIQQQ